MSDDIAKAALAVSLLVVGGSCYLVAWLPLLALGAALKAKRSRALRDGVLWTRLT